MIRRKIFLQNRTLTSIGIVFRLNKTLFTHFHFDYARINCFFVTQNRKLLNSQLKMSAFIEKNSVNKVRIGSQSATLKLNLKLMVFGAVFSLFYCSIFTDFPKKMMRGGFEQKNRFVCSKGPLNSTCIRLGLTHMVVILTHDS